MAAMEDPAAQLAHVAGGGGPALSALTLTDLKVPLKVRTSAKEDAGERRTPRNSRGGHDRAGTPTQQPTHSAGAGGGYCAGWMWSAPYGYENADLSRQASAIAGAPGSPVPMAVPFKTPYMFVPMVPDSPRGPPVGPTPLMGSPVGTPTAMMFPQTPFAQHAPFAQFNAAPGVFHGHSGPSQGAMGAPLEPMSPASRAHSGYFHPLFNGFSPFLMGQPMGPHGAHMPSPKQRTSGGGADKFRAYYPSPLKPGGSRSCRTSGFTGASGHSAASLGQQAYWGQYHPAASGPSITNYGPGPVQPMPYQVPQQQHQQHMRPPQIPQMRSEGPMQVRAGEQQQHQQQTTPRPQPQQLPQQHQQHVEQVAPGSLSPLGSPPPPLSQSAAEAAAEAVAEAVAAARVSLSGGGRMSMTGTPASNRVSMTGGGRMSLSGGPRVSTSGNDAHMVAAAAAAAAAVALQQAAHEPSVETPGSASSAAAAMVAAAAAASVGMDSMSSGEVPGSTMPMYSGMGNVSSMSPSAAAAAAAAAAMSSYPGMDLSGLTAQYWQGMPQLQGLAMQQLAGVPVMQAGYPMAQAPQVGLMHAAMMQQLSSGMPMQHSPMAATAAAMHGFHGSGPFLDATTDHYMAAAEQLAQLQALQGGVQAGHFGLRGATPISQAMAAAAGVNMPAGLMPRGVMPGALPHGHGGHRHHRRNAGEVRVGPDGQARLNARQRRTLRRAKERAIRGLLEAGQVLVARAGVDDADGVSNSYSEGSGDEDDDEEATADMSATPETARSRQLAAGDSADASPLRPARSSGPFDAAADAGSHMSPRSLAAAVAFNGAAVRTSTSGASSVCDAAHSNNSSSTCSPAGTHASDVSSPMPPESDSARAAGGAARQDLHATLLRNLDSLKEKMGPTQQKLVTAAVSAATGAAAAPSASEADDLSQLIQQLHLKKEDGVIDEKLMRDLQIIQNLIGALKVPVPAAQPPRQRGPAGPTPVAQAGTREVYLTNKPPKGIGMVH